MEVVGQCAGNKRKHADVSYSAETHSISTPVPSESGEDELQREKKKRDEQDQHTEARFRERLGDWPIVIGTVNAVLTSHSSPHGDGADSSMDGKSAR